MKLPPARDLLLIAAEKAELGPARIGHSLAEIVASWGPSEASGDMTHGFTLHRWGGIQVTCARTSIVHSFAVVCDPKQPPLSNNVCDWYEQVCAIRLADLPPTAKHIQLPPDEDEVLFSAGRIQCVFDVGSGTLLKLLTLHV